jgi:hypothetical protein
MRRKPMRTQAAFFGCCLLFLATAVAAPGGVTVNFVNPRHYTDAGHYGRDTEHNLRVLRSDLEDLGARCLAAGETLDIQVMDDTRPLPYERVMLQDWLERRFRRNMLKKQ